MSALSIDHFSSIDPEIGLKFVLKDKSIYRIYFVPHVSWFMRKKSSDLVYTTLNNIICSTSGWIDFIDLYQIKETILTMVKTGNKGPSYLYKEVGEGK